VRLANRLCDWSIDVKTEEQFRELDLGSEARRAASSLFGEEEEILRVDELPGVEERVAAALATAGIEYIEDFLARQDEELLAIEGLSAEDIGRVRGIIEENVEVIEEERQEEQEAPEEPEEAYAEEESEVYECPDCGAVVTPEMTQCPQCGVALSFEYEDETANDQES